MFQRTVPPTHGLVGSALLALLLGCGGGTSTAPGADSAPHEGTTVSAAPALPGPWLGGFEAGLDADETLWLLPVNGEPRSVMPPNDDPPQILSRSTMGYPDESGYVSRALFDAAQQRVIVTSRRASGSVTRWLDLNTARWTTLDLAGEQTLRDTERGALILSIDGNLLTLTGALESEFETIARVPLPAGVSASGLATLRYLFGGAERVFVGGVGQFERGGVAWRRLASPLPTGAEPAWLTPSPDGTRLCAVAPDGSDWLVNASGALALDLNFLAARCGFSPDGSLATFMGRPGNNQLHLAQLTGAPVADFEYLYLQANRDGFAYGTTGAELVRLDWRTLELETLSSPEMCPGRALESGDPPPRSPGLFHEPHLVGSFAVVEERCACTDCHASAVYLLSLEQGAVAQPLLDASEWDILQIARLADGSLLIATRWFEYPDHLPVPRGDDRFLRVFPDGRTATLGPFPDLPTPLHAPLGPLAP